MRIGIIGAGHWHAPMHLHSLSLDGDAHIVGISDPQIEATEQLAKQAGGRVFSDYGEMLASTHPDFVLAMGRPSEMPEIGHELISHGIPCALEKPVGVTAGDVAPLVDLAQKQGPFVAVPFTNRYSAMWTWLERLEEGDRLGLRSHAYFRIINGPPARYERDGVSWMLDPAISGGGSMRNLGIHAADAFLQYTGGEKVEVVGATVSSQVYGRDVEELGVAILRSESGVVGTIEAGYTFASMDRGDFEGRVASSNCTIIDHGDSMTVATLDDGRVQTIDIPDQAARYDQFCVDTLARLRGGDPPVATIEDCYWAMHLIDEIYEAAVRGLPDKG